jgi:hypothetical protein
MNGTQIENLLLKQYFKQNVIKKPQLTGVLQKWGISTNPKHCTSIKHLY